MGRKSRYNLWSYYAGMESGTALAGILAGRINPSGKLAETFPRVMKIHRQVITDNLGEMIWSVMKKKLWSDIVTMRKMIFCRCSALDMDSLIQNLRITICKVKQE